MHGIDTLDGLLGDILARRSQPWCRFQCLQSLLVEGMLVLRVLEAGEYFLVAYHSRPIWALPFLVLLSFC